MAIVSPLQITTSVPVGRLVVAQLVHHRAFSAMPCHCPQLRMSNGIFNRTDGAIILGTQVAPGCMIHPKAPYEDLCERMRKNLARQRPVSLMLVD